MAINSYLTYLIKTVRQMMPNNSHRPLESKRFESYTTKRRLIVSPSNTPLTIRVEKDCTRTIHCFRNRRFHLPKNKDFTKTL